MSGSKQTQTMSQTRDPYIQAKPAIDQSISGVQQWLSNPASSAAYQGGMSGWTQQGLDNLAASKGAGQSADYLTKVLNGDFLNPYQSDLDNSIIASVMPSVNATFSNAGMAGSTAHQGALTQGLTSGLAAPRYQNYAAERAAQQAAAGMLPGVDNQIAQNQIAAGQAKEGYDRAQFEENRTAGLRPYLETQGVLSTYGNMGGTSSGTTTTASKPSLAQTIAGGAMTGLGIMSGIPGIGTMGAGMSGFAPSGSLPWQRNYNPIWAYATGN